jgi:transposase
MAQTICPLLSIEDRQRLAAVLVDRYRPQKHVARARIILHSAERLDVAEVARRAQISRPAVWRWQQRFAEAGVAGLLRDKTRKPGKLPTPEATVRRVVALTCGEPPGEATHWTGRMMAKTAGLSLRTVQRIWAAHRLQPHRLRSFKRSRDPDFVAKLADIVGLYLAPPRHAVVLSVDEKSQIQALDRTQPGLPLKKGRAGTMTHDYKRHGTTTLFAALDVATGKVIGRCLKRHRHQEFLTFLRDIDRATPKRLDLDLIVDNYATHKHPKVKAWLAKHPRFRLHFTPTSASWLNLVERFFGLVTEEAIRRGVFKSVADLEAAIEAYLEHHNADPKPFIWTAPAADILEKVARGRRALVSVH